MKENRRNYLTPFRSVLILVSLIILSTQAMAAEVGLKRAAQEIQITAHVQEDFAGTEARVSSPEAGTIEIRVAGADFLVDGKRQIFRFEDEAVRAVSVSRDGSDGVVRFNIKGINSSAAAEQLQVTRGKERIRIAIPTELAPVTAAMTGVRTAVINESPELAQVDSEKSAATEPPALTSANDVSVVAPTEKGSTALPADASATTTKVSKKDERPESEIPVFSAAAAEKKQASSGIERLVITLFILCVVLGAAVFGLKKWSIRRKAGSNSPTKIQILTQHYIGPKKSLAIVQVAGEAILIGITEQNISMLKTLALIDDEVPGLAPKNFSDELDREDFDTDGDPPENFAMKGLGEVQDVFNKRFSTRNELRKPN